MATTAFRKPLQYYKHNYAKVCMTGLLGCRWHRYTQSKHGSRKCDIVWFVVLLVTSLFAIFWFYFTLISGNDQLDLKQFMFYETYSWFGWYSLLLVVFSILMAYLIILLLLSLCHIIQGHQLYIHPLHLVVILLILVICIAFTVTVHMVWRAQWSVLYISLQMFGPFLQIGSVCVMTGLTWVISHEWFKVIKTGWKVTSLCLYVMIMLTLYMYPLCIKSPCIISAVNLPTRPKLFAHRGAPMIAPENTVISFEIAAQNDVYGFETDVTVSFDGEPFIMHDKTLRRTTNIEEVFPTLIDLNAFNFNLSELSILNAGNWFVKHDPTGTVHSLSDKQKSYYNNQSIPTFLDILELAIKYDKAVMFDLQRPPSSHPYFLATYDKIVDQLNISGINTTKIYWVTPVELYTLPDSYIRLHPEPQSVEFIKQNNLTGVNLANEDVDLNLIRDYKKHNILTSVYMVNTEWLYSYYWCLGIDYVTTDDCSLLSKLKNPIWHMSPVNYLILWVMVDVLSTIIVIMIFCCNRNQLSSSGYQLKHFSLNPKSNVRSHWVPKRHCKSLKERLILQNVQADTYDFEPDIYLGIDSNGYELTMTAVEGHTLSQAFNSNRTSFSSNRVGGCMDELISKRESYRSNVESGDLDFLDSK